MRHLILCLIVLTGSLQLRAEPGIRNGDVFEMRLSGAAVEYLQEFSNLALVVNDGFVNVPMIGRIRAEGLSTTQIATAIEKKYRDEKIFTNPVVSLNPVQTAVNQRKIIIGGAVRAPGDRAWSADLTLTAAIALAGGPGEWATDAIKIIRAGKAEKYSRKAIAKNPSADPLIQAGDMIVVEGDF